LIRRRSCAACPLPDRGRAILPYPYDFAELPLAQAPPRRPARVRSEHAASRFPSRRCRDSPLRALVFAGPPRCG
jgi:hypothetical protein